jgi:hypothetical protein
MKARELPGTPFEEATLRDEITEIAAEGRDPDPRAHLVCSGLAAIRGRAAGLLALAARVKRSLLPSGRGRGDAPRG